MKFHEQCSCMHAQYCNIWPTMAVSKKIYLLYEQALYISSAVCCNPPTSLHDIQKQVELRKFTMLHLIKFMARHMHLYYGMVSA